MARPSLADSLRASLNKGVHVDTAEKIARGLPPILDEPETLPPISIAPVSIQEPVVAPVIVQNLITKPSDRLVVTPLDGNTVTPFDRNTVRQSNRITVEPLHGITVTPSNADTETLSNTQTVSPSHRQTVSYTQTRPQTVSHFIPRDVLNLAYNQACVLECLIGNATGITNARAIADQTQVSIHSVREAVQRLIAKGFMAKPVTVKNAAFQGFSYVLNKTLCDHFINAGGLGQDNYRDHETVPETVWGSHGDTVSQQNSLTRYSSREFLEDSKPTTTPYLQSVSPSNATTLKPSNPSPSHGDTPRPSNGDTIKPSEGFILTGAVGAYWEEEGLGEGQTQKWCQQFEVDPSQMKQQLEWARYDLEVNGRRGEVKKDTISWFFGHLRTTGGCFPRPINYKSPAEIRAESIEQELIRDREAKERLAAAEAEREFQAILTDPGCIKYKELFSRVNGFAQEEGGLALETAMRVVFLEEKG